MPGGFPLGLELCNANDQGTDTANSRGTAVATGTTAGTFGSYAQLTASTPYDTVWMDVAIDSSAASFSNNIIVSIAIGAAASELVIVPNLMLYNGSSSRCGVRYSFPISIPAGTRIAAKAAGSQSGGADTCYLQVTLFDGAFTQLDGVAGYDSIGAGTAKGTTLTTGAANTKGSYAQLSASTSRDYIGFLVGIDNTGAGTPPATTPFLTDIAIGAAASEVIILPNMQHILNAANANAYYASPAVSTFFPIAIPASTRVAARSQCNAATKTMALTLYGAYQ